MDASFLTDHLVNPICYLICRLCSSISTQLGYVANLDENIVSLKIELNELREKRDDLKRKLEQPENVGLQCTSQVKGWLQRVDTLDVEVSSFIEDVTQSRQKGICCLYINSSAYKKGKKVSEKIVDIGQLKGKGDFETIFDGLNLDAVEELPSKPTVGLDSMLEKALTCLVDEEAGTIAVYGMGGVGKTTLLKAINNEFLNRFHHYDVVIWVMVPKEFVVDKIQQAIGARLGLSWEGTETQEDRASKIYRILRRKKFLLLLDDIWEGLDLEKIGVPFPNKYNKSKVIFTTRSMHVCSEMDAQRRIRVEFLGETEAWELFSEKVGKKDILESDSVRLIAKTIVRKCGGLPLALITVGRTMANKETEDEWLNAIQELNRTPSELEGMEKVFSLLKFSYDNLKDDISKVCFLYCSLFPEDYSIEKEQLVEYWIGEGFLDKYNDNHVHAKGHDVIGSLKVACLLESGEDPTQVKMHDVVRSFALWIASDCGLNRKNYLVEPSMGLTAAPLTKEWQEAQRISLMDNEIMELSRVPLCNVLSTLLLQWNSGLNKITGGFFQFMPCLRVLDLSFTSLRDIPLSIQYLVELCHLDLSGTKITSVPRELGNLSKLKYLDLQRTRLLHIIPHEALSRLSQLRVLNLYYSYSNWKVRTSGDQRNIYFSDLECLRHLRTLGITVAELHTLEILSRFSNLLERIQFLYIKECDGLNYLEMPAASSERLRRLSINNCFDLKYLAFGEGDSLRSLEVLALHGLPNLAEVWKNPVRHDCLRHLRSLNIWYCHKLKKISWILHLPKLEVVYIFYCKEIEELVGGEERVQQSKAFQSLKTLSIRDLPKLTTICSSPLAFPSLQRIAVIECPRLRKLQIKAVGASTLPTIYGTKEWWDTLEWDESSTKSVFLSQFMATN